MDRSTQYAAAMQEAVDLHRGGRFVEAAARYRAVLAEFGDEPDTLHLLGLATNRLSGAHEALALVERAVALAPQHPGFRASQGNLLLELGRAADSEAAFRAGLVGAPSDPEIRNGLANALRVQRRFPDAEKLLREVVHDAPRFVAALDNLAALLLERRQPEDAERFAAQAIALAPDDALAHNNYGSALYQQRKAAEAEPSLKRALALRPDYFEAKHNLGLVLVALRRQHEADPLLRECVKHDPNNAAYLMALSDTVRELSLSDEAYALAQRAHQIDPESTDIKLCLAAALQEHNEHGAAADLLDQVVAIHPSVVAWSMLAYLRWELGQLEDARAAVAEALKLDPADRSSRVVLANAARVGSLDDPNLKELERIVARTDLTEDELVGVRFALGKSYDDCGDHVRAFQQYAAGNRRRREQLPPFDRAGDARTLDECRKVFASGTLARLAAHGLSSDVPVFVVGMPRSGTSLAEQIVASHPEAFGAGELLKMREIVARIAARSEDRGGPDYPHALATLAPAEIGEFARMYLDTLRGAAGEPKARVVDKMPVNFKHVGLIATLFPRAHIVHCTRDPMDNCLSIYFQNFGRGNNFAYDLEDLASFYGNYRRLMAFWHELLPGRILDLPYEGVVGESERWSRTLIEHIGLPWDPRCLDFHETERAVRTASAWQVKQPIYKRSVARWKRYGAELEPLRRALIENGVEVEG